MKLVPGIRYTWYKIWSMKFIILTAFLSSAMATFAIMPAEWQADIPNKLIKICAILTFLSAGLAGVSRVIQQPSLDCPEPQEEKEEDKEC